jgi:Rhs element Vgr protein
MPQPNAILKSTSLPSFTILSNGIALDASQVISIRISTEIGKIPDAEIILSDGNVAKQTFEVSTKNDFTPGNELEIKVGYHQKNKGVFKGNIIKHSIRTSSSQNSTLTIELKHSIYKSTLQRKNGVFLKSKDGDTIDTILGKYGIQKSVETTQLEHQQMIQMNSSDWDFVNMRAEANNLLVLPKLAKIEIKKPETGLEKIELSYGKSIVDVDLEMDNRVDFEDFTAKTWNPAEQKFVESNPTVAGLTEIGNLSASALSSKAKHPKFLFNNGATLKANEVVGVLNAQKTKSILSKIRGTVKCEGTSEVEIGDTIKLSGLGDRFNGKAYVTGVLHEISAGRWFTTFQVGLNPERFVDRYTDINEKPASGLLPAVNGLQIGKVAKIISENDEPNILVKIPIASESSDAVWARVARLDAGNKRGSIFHPEEGDEVILGFINDDPRQAIILGMLNSSKNPVPEKLKAADKNPIKGFVTRSELKLLFDDDKKILTIQTPKGKIEIDDDKKTIVIKDDSNKNTITLSDKGIAIECEKDLSISAKGDIKIEGKKVEIKAKSSFSAEGASGASIKSNGTTEIKGSMVNIN